MKQSPGTTPLPNQQCAAPQGLGLADTTVSKLLNILGEDGPKYPKGIEDICLPTNLYVFVGNAEPLGKIRLLAPANDALKTAISNQMTSQAQDFHEAIKRSVSGISQGLKANDCYQAYETMAPSGFDGQKEVKLSQMRDQLTEEGRGRTLFLSITDGPGFQDSAIKTIWYGYKKGTGQKLVWGQLHSQDWHWNHRSQKVLAGKKPFELRLSTDLAKIIKLMSRLDVKGEIQSEPLAPSSNAYYGVNFFDQTTFVIKTHGGLANESASAVPNLVERDMPSTNFPLLLLDSHGPDYTLLGSEFYIPLWYHESACHLYKDSDIRTTENETILDQYYEEEGCSGKKAKASPTAGIDSISCNTASSGKSQILRRSKKGGLPPFHDHADILKPDAVITLGEGVTYEALQEFPAGIKPFTLLEGKANISEKTADLIILDSCYGSDKINEIIPRTQKDATGQGHIITIASPNPLYYDLIRYDLLSDSDYRMLNRLMVSNYAKHKEDLVQYLAGGLSDSTTDELEERGFRTLEVKVFEKTTATPEPPAADKPQVPANTTITTPTNDRFAEGKQAALDALSDFWTKLAYVDTFTKLPMVAAEEDRVYELHEALQTCPDQDESYCEGWAVGAADSDWGVEAYGTATEIYEPAFERVLAQYKEAGGPAEISTEAEQKAFQTWWIEAGCPERQLVECQEPSE